MERTKIKELLKGEHVNKKVQAKGWVRTFRNDRFISLNDGSTLSNIQVVVEPQDFKQNVLKQITTGAAIAVMGELIDSPAKGQKYEIQATQIEVIGTCDADEFPLQPKKHSLEFLRDIAHLRSRTSTFSAVFRIRHSVAFAIHKYFNDNGFFYLHTPIITGSDCEGAGEMFRVTSFNLNDVPKTEGNTPDFSKDFFGKECNLTVSGQLEAELGAMGLGQVYTFGPTFRAENSNTTRHLAEFWMIEPEVAFSDLQDNMKLVEEFLKYIIGYILENHEEDLAFLESRLLEEEKSLKQEERSELGLREKLEFVLNNDFEHLSYTEAFQVLRNSKPNQKKKFQFPVNEWGVDFQSEHERYLVEKKYKKPVIIYDYPKDIKAFYMRNNDDGKTVAAMDVLFPGIGEIVGGSQREERYDLLEQRMDEMDVNKEELWWYLETRKFGTVPHSGFGLGFERLVQFVTGMKNIRDVIPFPRSPKNAEF